MNASHGFRLCRPRKTNSSALKKIAAGDLLWDRRAVARTAEKRARKARERQEARPTPHRLTRKQRAWLLRLLPGWSYDTERSAFVVPDVLTEAGLVRLVEALHYPYAKRGIIRITGVSREQAQAIADTAPDTCSVILVRSDGSMMRMRPSDSGCR